MQQDGSTEGERQALMEGWRRQLLVAGGGLALVLFLLLHLAGVSLALLAPLRFEGFASWLHGRPWLPAAELLLALALLAHPLASLARTLANRSRSEASAAPRRSRRGGGLEAVAAASGRWLPLSGGVLLLFLAVHLAQLRWSRPPAGMELTALLAALASPVARLLYGLAGVALGLHLLHGVESAHRSLGWLESGNGGRIRLWGRGLALLLGGGFALLPFALVLATSR
ncbi:MAG: succinate dehydrogenase [Synechococcaceae cyanobacterium]|nr:succinate dehydrogenase [Synechococcaceae cyanobacterium]